MPTKETGFKQSYLEIKKRCYWQTTNRKRISEYFKEMQIVTLNDGKQVIYVVASFPNGWIIDKEIETKFDITIQYGDYQGEYYFCGEIENGEGVVFDAIEYNIERMKEAIERAQLLSEKTKELKRLVEDESITIEQLRTLKISYDKTNTVNMVVPKKQESEKK